MHFINASLRPVYIVESTGSKNHSQLKKKGEIMKSRSLVREIPKKIRSGPASKKLVQFISNYYY